jgi:hypothetical protein
MISKVLEIRDEGTHIPALAIRMVANSAVQSYYLNRCGYPKDGSSIMLMMLYDGKATNDPYEWTALHMGPRTLPVAHDYIIKHFDDLIEGDVVDVSFILGESQVKKVSERGVHVK